MRSALLPVLLLGACAPQDSGVWTPLREGWQAELRADHQARIDPEGATYEGVGLRLRAWGRPGQLQDLGPARPELSPCFGACVPQIEQQHPGLTAWWQARDTGLRQGWDLEAPPPGSGPIQLITRVDGAVPEGSGDEILLRGARTLRVAEVAARDARGRALPAELFVRGQDLIVEVQDKGAIWPIWVDPVYTSAGLVISSPSSGSGFGTALARVGDLNHDGYDDLAVGAPRVNKVYLYYGGPGGPSTAPDLVLVESGDFGISVDGRVDIDCDGYDDLVVGAPSFNASSGRVYIYRGSATGLSTTAFLTIDGQAQSAYAGYSVAGLGDVDGDACDDLLIGAYGAVNSSGAVGILFGDNPVPSQADGVLLFGAEEGDGMGRSVAGPGDTNGDGLNELAFGSCYAENYAGAFDVLYGATERAFSESPRVVGDEANAELGCPIRGAGDINGDGLADLVVAAPSHSGARGSVYTYLGATAGLGSTPSQEITGADANITFGSGLGGGGDIDGDGYDDVVVGAHYADGGVGAAYIYRGSPSGLDTANPTTLSGTASAGSFGVQVAIVGDLNGGGYDDVAVSATGEGSGAVHLYLGDADDDGDGTLAYEDCDDSDPTLGLPVLSYPDEDVDGYGDESTSELSCFVRTGWVTQGGDCDDSARAIHPDAVEQPGDAVDQDCDGQELCYADADDDGFRGEVIVSTTNIDCDTPGVALEAEANGDCDDSDPNVHPGAPETWYDGVDSDCVGDDDFDQDHDGYGIDDDPPDCDDTLPDVYPGASEETKDCVTGEEQPPALSLSGGCTGCGGGSGGGWSLLPLLALLRRQVPSARNLRKPRSA